VQDRGVKGNVRKRLRPKGQGELFMPAQQKAELTERGIGGAKLKEAKLTACSNSQVRRLHYRCKNVGSPRPGSSTTSPIKPWKPKHHRTKLSDGSRWVDQRHTRRSTNGRELNEWNPVELQILLFSLISTIDVNRISKAKINTLEQGSGSCMM
jgi:hypothetical protein